MKYIKILLLTAAVYLGLATAVNAAGSLLVRIEEPGSPVGTKNFQVDFVASDIEGRTIGVECYVKKPGGSFVVFDSKSLPAGGSSGVCQVTESHMGGVGTHDFYIKATAGSDVVTSSTVSVDFDDASPGTPSNYSRETISSCQYRVKFRTASDGGVTTKVVLYRSDTTPYTADNGTKVGDIGIGSDQNGEIINTVPDCTKTYYYSIRAFSSSGIGSGITGDPDATTFTEPTTETGEAGSGAIPTEDSQVTEDTGKILGDTTDDDPEGDGQSDEEDKQVVDGEGEVKGEEDSILDRLKGNGATISGRSWIIVIPAIGIPVIFLIALVWYLLRRRKE
ncbi:hypothetical protein ACFL2C_00590 [Patescibacteria group bacterium]